MGYIYFIYLRAVVRWSGPGSFWKVKRHAIEKAASYAA